MTPTNTTMRSGGPAIHPRAPVGPVTPSVAERLQASLKVSASRGKGTHVSGPSDPTSRTSVLSHLGKEVRVVDHSRVAQVAVLIPVDAGEVAMSSVRKGKATARGGRPPKAAALPMGREAEMSVHAAQVEDAAAAGALHPVVVVELLSLVRCSPLEPRAPQSQPPTQMNSGRRMVRT